LTATTTRTVTVAVPNVAPTAAFQFLPTTGPAPLFAFFDGSASTDPEGPIASYSWDFGDGTGVVAGKTPTHTFATAGTFTVRLTVADEQGATGTTTQNITVTAGTGGANPTISGRVTFERVPFSSTVSSTVGLNYLNITAQPAREVVVELIAAGNGLALASTTTDSNGNYAFTVPSGVNAFVRAKAQALRATVPRFNIRVLNNTGGNALYVLDGSTFNTGTANQTRNLNAASGWGGSSYTGTRAAAPFAVLDTLYSAAEFVHDNGSATLNLPALDVFWSPLNNTADGDVATGAIVSTLYRTAGAPTDPPAGIYVLGLENNDTDEYDQHVLAHEFQHYLENIISRTDTVGGEHSSADRLDLRVAFSEGFANAFSAMVVGSSVYRDSLGAQQGQSFNFNMESNSASPRGWFNETSVQSIVWDLYDGVADASDSVQLGYKPLYDALVGPLLTTPALTSIYPLLTYLKGRAGAPVAGISALAAGQNITGTDAFGAGETNDGSVPQSLPIYQSIALNSAVTVCGTTTAGSYNKIGNRLFLRFNLGAARLVAIRAQYSATGSTAPFSPTSDPDIVLFKSGFLDVAETTTAGDELLTRTLEAGEYVIEVYEYSHVDTALSDAQRRGNTCFNVSVTG
jgi:PKD repeat protein